MIRKFLKVSALVAMSLSLVACGQGGEKANTNAGKGAEKKTEAKKEESKGFISLVTDFGNIDDKSFNQASWEGINMFASKSNYKKDFYRAELQESVEARKEVIDKAVTAGADVLVCPGFLFQNIVYEAQTKYPDKHFVLIDTEPADAQGNVKAEKNVYSILYKEEQVGYLAGYAAVMEGYRKLGFLGGMDIAPVKALGYGYVQGAEAAAKALNLPAGSIQMRYKYAGGFVATDVITKDMTAWYTTGTEVIFSCGGGIVESVIQAAGTDANRKIIGVDVDQASLSDHIIFSALKGIANSVNLALEVFDKNNKQWSAETAGKTDSLGIEKDCVGLSATEGSWRMTKFTIDQYNQFYESIKASTPVISRYQLPTLAYVKVVMN